MKKLVLIDSYALIHRSYHALPPLTSPEGILVNGVYGFTLVFLKMLRDIQPDYVVAAFDMAAPTFRKKEFLEYKAGRKKMPDNFYEQVELVHQLLDHFGVPVFEKAGYEADDIIGTIVNKLAKENIEIIILTGDLDTLQLVSSKVKVYTLRRGIKDNIIYTPKELKKRFHLLPSQIIDWKSLRGDPSDNVPGVPGIGEKTAQKLISSYHNLDNLYKAIQKGKVKEVSPRIIDLLKQYKEQAYFSQHLVTIKQDVAINFDLSRAQWQPPIQDKLAPFLKKLGFYRLLQRIFPESDNSSTKQIFTIKNIDSPRALKELEKEIKQYPKIGFLLDYSGEKFLDRTIKGAGISLPSNQLFYIPTKFIPSILQELASQPRSFISFSTKVLQEHFIVPPQINITDIEILSWLIDSSRKDYKIRALVNTFLDKDIADDFVSQLAYLLPLEEQINLKIQSLELENVWQEIEKPLIPVLALMEKVGISIDKHQLTILGQENKEKLDQIEQQIFQISHQKFNINSRTQLEKILFEQLEVSSEGLKKTAKGNISLNIQALTKIMSRHPIIPLVIKYRERKKLQNSFLDTLPNFIDSTTGKIYTIWKQTGASTGRLSSEKPNLQNIPQSKKDLLDLRTIFLPSQDWQLISLDYSQMELRLAAHLSQDEKLQNIFKEGKDVHIMTASYINNIPENKVTPSMRQQAKALNFGILYGMGVKSFAEQANIPLIRAKQFREEYFHNFPGLERYLKYLQKRAKELGYAETMFGRKRFLPLIGGYGRISKEQERIALNMPIQGLAADIIKMAMVKIHYYILARKWEDKVRTILQVHDELILEGQPAIIKEIAREGKNIMENIVRLNIPLVVNVKQGNNWGQMELL